MRTRVLVTMAATLLGAVLAIPAPPASAQLGPFRWQLSPFCNVLTLTATPIANLFSMSGFDDNCGGTPTGVSGTAFPAGGNFGMSLTTLGATGVPSVVQVTGLNPSTLQGAWSDTSGQSGSFLIVSGSGTGSLLPDATLPAGPPGATGPAGATGAQGPAGATNVVVRSVVIPDPGTGLLNGAINCNPGEVATGGGVRISGVVNNTMVVASHPVASGQTPTGWTGISLQPPAQDARLIVFAICASP